MAVAVNSYRSLVRHVADRRTRTLPLCDKRHIHIRGRGGGVEHGELAGALNTALVGDRPSIITKILLIIAVERGEGAGRSPLGGVLIGGRIVVDGVTTIDLRLRVEHQLFREIRHKLALRCKDRHGTRGLRLRL